MPAFFSWLQIRLNHCLPSGFLLSELPTVFFQRNPSGDLDYDDKQEDTVEAISRAAIFTPQDTTAATKCPLESLCECFLPNWEYSQKVNKICVITSL